MPSRNLRDAKQCGDALREAFKASAWVRASRAELIKLIVGPYYGKERASLPADPLEFCMNLSARPVNLAGQLYMGLLPHLTGEQIQCSLSPLAAGLLGEMPVVQIALENEITRTDAARVHARAVSEALVSGCGAYQIARTATAERVTVRDHDLDPGQLCLRSLDADDLIRDTTSKVPEEDCFRAGRWRQSRQYMLDSGIFDNDAIVRLDSLNKKRASSTRGDAENVAIEQPDDAEEDLIEGWNVMIREGNTVLSGVRSSLEGEDVWLIEPMEWEGKGEGPIELLPLIDVPGQGIAMTPLLQIIDLHYAKSTTAAKILQQILETDVKLVYEPKGEKIVEDLRDPRSRNIRGDPTTFKETVLGGHIEEMTKGYEWIQREANNEGLNAQQLAGVEAPSELATGIAALQGAIMGRVGHLRDRTTGGLRRVLSHMLDEIYADPIPREVMEPLSQRMHLQHVLHSGNRVGRADLYRIDVSPFTPDASDPNMARARFAEFMEACIRWIAGVAQSGGNPQAAVQLLAKEYRRPEINDIFPTPMGQQIAQQGQQVLQASGASKPPQRPRSLVGQSRSDQMRGQPAMGAY